MPHSGLPVDSNALRLYVLGTFRLQRAQDVLELSTRKAEALLAYLALHPREHTREKLAALYWGDSSEEQARTSLRAALAAIRRALGQDSILADREKVQLNPECKLGVDALEFTALTDASGAVEPARLETAIALYSGDLLADWYDEWVLTEREAYRSLYLDALLRAAQERRTRGEYERAIELAQQVLKGDAANERAHQQLMFCYNASGQREAALKQYDECVRLLQSELGVEPATETRALYQWIKQAPVERQSPEARRSNLPVPATSFIGRERAVAAVQGLLTTSRLLTLTGSGGCGKTRLAIQVAGLVLDAYPDGVWWVDLSALVEPESVVRQVAKVLGVRETGQQPLFETLAEYLRERRVLLILDNCEHLVAACAQLAANLLDACPDLRLLATSREALGVADEVTWHVPSLSLPQPWELLSGETGVLAILPRYEAARLFAERAVTVKPDWKLTMQNARAVADICRHLDGIPLALELAAARVRVLSVEQIAARLDDRFNLLVAGNRTARPRQQTLRAAMDWSYELLDVSEQRLFARLAVFAGDFEIEAVESVCGVGTVSSELVILDTLARLIDKSLVSVQYSEAEAHYHLLETIRQYALGKLVASGEASSVRSHHLDHFLHFAEEAESLLKGAEQTQGQARGLARLDKAYDNLLAALNWAIERGESEGALRLSSALASYWNIRGELSEARRWLQQALELPAEGNTASRSAARAKALYEAGRLAVNQGDYAAAQALLQESLAICEARQDIGGCAAALNYLGVIASEEGNLDAARTLFERNLGLRRAQGDQRSIAGALSNLGVVALHQRDYEHAQELLEESLELRRELGDRRPIASALNNLGLVFKEQGQLVRARELFAESLALKQELGDKYAIAITLDNLGEIASLQRDFMAARALHSESLRLRQQLGDKLGLAFVLIGLSRVDVSQGRYRRAARLLGFVDALLATIGASLPPNNRKAYDYSVAAVRGILNQGIVAEEQAAGRLLSIEQAVEYALEELPERAI